MVRPELSIVPSHRIAKFVVMTQRVFDKTSQIPGDWALDELLVAVVCCWNVFNWRQQPGRLRR